MRWSRYYIPTLKEAPADAEVVSHKLLVRAGMIRKLTSGIYTWLPLGLRALEKAKAIVRREMNAAGACEVLMPMVIPADLWIETGRWEKFGDQLLRFKDRNERDYCLGPTHEEVVTDLLRGEVRSYRQLPLNLYQIQTKFRDELRPRFGLMRGREFMMKDAYSFDADDAGADRSYLAMRDAYHRIFSGMTLGFRQVEADTGAIGGNFSHEFMVLAETGEDTIASCTGWPECDWAANVERAPIVTAFEQDATPCPPLEEVSTPAQHSIEDVCAFLRVEPSALIKTLLLVADGKPVAVLLRGSSGLRLARAGSGMVGRPGGLRRSGRAERRGPHLRGQRTEKRKRLDSRGQQGRRPCAPLEPAPRRDPAPGMGRSAQRRGRRPLPALRQAGGAQARHRSGAHFQTGHQVQ